MPAKSLMFLAPALVTDGLVIERLAANAAGLLQIGTMGDITSPVTGNCLQQKRETAGGWAGLWQIGPSLPKPL